MKLYISTHRWPRLTYCATVWTTIVLSLAEVLR